MPYQTNPDLASPLGRSAELAELRALLDRDTPSNVSVVGPKRIGKTLLLRALARDAAGWGRFAAVAQWDVRRHTPASDAAFFAGAATALAGGLAASHPDFSEFLRDEPSYDSVEEVIGALEDEETRVLLVVDHLERAMREPGISKSVWDNMRGLVQRGALVLVTATPRRLRELTEPDARTSEFWNVFAPPVDLGPFSPDDIGLLLRPLEQARGVLAPPSRKEFDRQTGGVPLLCVRLAGRLAEEPATAVEKAAVVEAARTLAHESDYVASLWDDLSAPAQAVLVNLAAQGDDGLPAEDVPRDRLADLALRGYVTRTSASRVAPGARMMLDHASLHQASAGDLARLFGPSADVAANTRALLQFRLEGVEGGDGLLRSDVSEVVRGLSARPERALKRLRELSEAATDAIIEAESPIPYDTVQKWRQSKKIGAWAQEKAPSGSDFVLRPTDRWLALRALEYLTDPREAGRPRTGLTHGTVEVLSAMRTLGNYGVHVAEYKETVPVELATAAAFLGVELFRRLSEEIPQPSGESPRQG